MVFLIGGLVVIAASLGVVIDSLLRAPVGYEDADGFHVIRAASPTAAVLSRRSLRRPRPIEKKDAALDFQLHPSKR